MLPRANRLSFSPSLILTALSHSFQTNLSCAISWSCHLASTGHTGETLETGDEIWRNPLKDAALAREMKNGLPNPYPPTTTGIFNPSLSHLTSFSFVSAFLNLISTASPSYRPLLTDDAQTSSNTPTAWTSVKFPLLFL